MKREFFWLIAIFLLGWASLTMYSVISRYQQTQRIDQLRAIAIPSLQAFYPRAIQEAEQWDEEFTLDLITIFIVPEKNRKRRGTKLIAAVVFISRNRPLEFLHVEYLITHQVTSKIGEVSFAFTDFSNSQINTVIDAPEAWDKFLEHPQMGRHEISEFDCALMRLMHSDEAVFWRLGVDNCEGKGVTIYDINAYTGEFIEE